MAPNAEDMIINAMVTGSKGSQRMQEALNLAEYQSKGTETEYMKYPKRSSNDPAIDIKTKESRRGWDEFEKGLAGEVAGWWNVRFGDPVTYDSRGHKIGFTVTGKDMRPRGASLDSDKASMVELKYQTDLERANADRSGYHPELREYMRNEDISAARRRGEGI